MLKIKSFETSINQETYQPEMDMLISIPMEVITKEDKESVKKIVQEFEKSLNDFLQPLPEMIFNPIQGLGDSWIGGTQKIIPQKRKLKYEFKIEEYPDVVNKASLENV